MLDAVPGAAYFASLERVYRTRLRYTPQVAAENLTRKLIDWHYQAVLNAMVRRLHILRENKYVITKIFVVLKMSVL